MIDINKKTSNNEIKITEDGMMFLLGGNHKILEYFSDKITVSSKSQKDFFANIFRRQKYCDKNNISYMNIIFPDKIYIHKNSDSNLNIKSLYRSSYITSKYYKEGLPNLYLDTILLNVKNAFMKTDTHLSLNGNRAVINEIMKPYFLDYLDAYNKFIDNNSKYKNFSGDLGKKITPNIEEKILFFKKPSNMIFMKNGLISGNEGLMILVKNEKACSNKKLLIFGDSFFRSLLPHLSFFYKEIVFCRTRFFHYEIVKAFQPDLIFSGIAERYFSKCELDENRPHFFTYPLIKEKKLDPDKGFGEMFSSFFEIKNLL